MIYARGLIWPDVTKLHFIQNLWFPIYSLIPSAIKDQEVAFKTNNQFIDIQVFFGIFTVLFHFRVELGLSWSRGYTRTMLKTLTNLFQRWQWYMNKNFLLMVKQNKTKQKNQRLSGTWFFFLQVKYETWIGFGLHTPNANDDSFCPFWAIITWYLSIIIQFGKRSNVTGITLQLK